MTPSSSKMRILVVMGDVPAAKCCCGLLLPCALNVQRIRQQVTPGAISGNGLVDWKDPARLGGNIVLGNNGG